MSPGNQRNFIEVITKSSAYIVARAENAPIPITVKAGVAAPATEAAEAPEAVEGIDVAPGSAPTTVAPPPALLPDGRPDTSATVLPPEVVAAKEVLSDSMNRTPEEVSAAIHTLATW
jgi:hypothetical protein